MRQPSCFAVAVAGRLRTPDEAAQNLDQIDRRGAPATRGLRFGDLGFGSGW
jgi:hypothetical protein